MIEVDLVRKHLAKIYTRKSMGLDEMHPCVLSEVTARPLCIIFERSWRMGEVPEDWRKNDITPVFKKGKKEDPGNYRSSQPHLCPWKGDGTAYSGCHLQAKWKKRRLSGVVNMDSPRGNHA